jgi:hypothetical protein
MESVGLPVANVAALPHNFQPLPKSCSFVYTVSGLACFGPDSIHRINCSFGVAILLYLTDGAGNKGTFFLEKRNEIFVLIQKTTAI